MTIPKRSKRLWQRSTQASLPGWGWKDEALKELFSTVHLFASFAFLSLIKLHVLAALKHLFIDRDGVFHRMLPNRHADPAQVAAAPGQGA